MAYNPGVSYRGEMLGQAIGQAGQSIAQSYGQGLQLKEQRKQRKELKKAYGMQAELLGMDKEDIDTMGLGELQGFVEGTKLKQSIDYQALQLQELQNNIAQSAAGKKALGQMQMYMEEQNLSAVDAATSASRDFGLELGEAAKLVNYATTGEKLGLELQTIQARQRGLDLQELGLGISERTAGVQERQVQLAEEAVEEEKKPPTTRTFNVGGRQYDQVGGRIFPVEADETELTQDQQRQSVSITKQAETAYEEADQIATGGGADQKTGDERTIFGTSRYNRLGEQFSKLRQLNSQYRASNNKDHPQYTEFLNRMVPLVTHMRTQGRDSEDLGKMLTAIGVPTMINQMRSEGRHEEGKALAEKFGIDYTR